MASKLEALKTSLEATLGGELKLAVLDRGELTIVLRAANAVQSCTTLRDQIRF